MDDVYGCFVVAFDDDVGNVEDDGVEDAVDDGEEEDDDAVDVMWTRGHKERTRTCNAIERELMENRASMMNAEEERRQIKRP